MLEPNPVLRPASGPQKTKASPSLSRRRAPEPELPALRLRRGSCLRLLRRRFLRSLLRCGLLGSLLGGLLGRLLGGLLRRGLLRRFLCGLLGRLLRGLLGCLLCGLLRRYSLLGLFGLLAFFFFFAFAIVVLLLPPNNGRSGVFSRHLRTKAQLESVQSWPPADRPSPNREAQSCEQQELTCHWQSAPCSRYCPRQSCPA